MEAWLHTPLFSSWVPRAPGYQSSSHQHTLLILKPFWATFSSLWLMIDFLKKLFGAVLAYQRPHHAALLITPREWRLGTTLSIFFLESNSHCTEWPRFALQISMGHHIFMGWNQKKQNLLCVTILWCQPLLDIFISAIYHLIRTLCANGFRYSRLKVNMSYDITYMWNKKQDTNELICKTEIEPLT